MFHRNKGRIPFFIFISILVILSCSPKYTIPRTEEEFSREISRLEKLTRENPDPSVQIKSHLELARLYTHYQNPGRDYLKGCREFAAYLSLVPADRKNDEIQNWVSALEELEKSEKEAAILRGENAKTREALNLLSKRNKELQDRLESLEKTNRSLSEVNRSLKESNEKMQETIVKLNQLDRQMEEKRRSIR